MKFLLKILVYFSRIIVGSLFIISGLIKMNDSYGFSYKLDEYFSVKALNMPDLIPYSLGLAVFICIAEVLLGVAVLIWAKPKLTNVLLFLMIAFFTWLTAYTATCDPFETVTMMIDGEMQETTRECVLTCGCFGNAIPLEPIESFYKDLFLGFWIVIMLVFTLFFEKKEDFDLSIQSNKRAYLIVLAASILAVALFCMNMLDWMFPVIFTAICLFVAEFIRGRMKSAATDWVIAGAVTVICGIFAYYTLTCLPMKDYRPYAEGQNIIENMMSAEEKGLEPPEYATEYSIKNKLTGADSTLLSSDWLKIYKTDHFKNTYEITSYDGPEIEIKPGYEPLITDFAPLDFFGVEMTDSILQYEGYTFMIISKDFNVMMNEDMSPLVKLYQDAKSKGHKVMALVAHDKAEEVREFQNSSGLSHPYYMTDEIVLKTMIRSNPGLILMKDGVVMKKWSWSCLPDVSEIEFD